MYKKFFGFLDEPFRLTPDPEFFYSSEIHDDAINTLEYAIDKRKGLMVLTGEVGTGKTTLVRVLLNKLLNTEVSFILNPFLSEEEILRVIAKDFGIEVEKTKNKGDVFNLLIDYTVKLYKNKKNALIIVDEAQHLPFESLEMIRQISNIEMENAKLVQVLLVGQSELIDRLNEDRYRQIKQRIAYWVNLEPLNLAETKNYINFRVQQALKYKRYIFKDSAIRYMYRVTKGNPREINQVADLSLIIAASNSKKKVGSPEMKKAAKEYYKFTKKDRKTVYYFIFALILIIFVLIIALKVK